MSSQRLYLVDAMAFCYRAFYALKGLSTSFGQPTNAIYGFVNMLNKILKKHQPEYMAACFDVSRDTFRQKKFAEYKIQRPPMPDGLNQQIPLIKEIIRAFGIAIYEKEGFEADDLIATLAKLAKAKGSGVTIVSSDKDMLQLVDEHTVVFSPYKDEGTTYDEKKVRERFGVKPLDIPDIVALMGDDADNIPGVPGIGEKTAVELIKNFGSLEQLLKHLDEIKQEKIKKAIAENLGQIKLSRELALLDKDMDLDFTLEKLKISPPDIKELFRLFQYLEFKRFLKDLPVKEANEGPASVALRKDEELKGLFGNSGELVLAAGDLGNFVFSDGPNFFRLEKIGNNAKGILANPQIKKIGHDLKKIKLGLAKQNIPLEGLYFDTMIAAYLINPAKSEYGLGNIAWDYLGSLYRPELIDSAKAVGLILELRPKLEKALREKSLFGLFNDLEMPLVEVLAKMEQNGIKLDLKVLKQLALDLEKRLIKLIEQIYEISGCQFNINSPKQLGEVLFSRLKLPVVKRSKTGPSTDEEVLKKLSSKHELPALLLEYRQLTKLKTTYVDTLPNLTDADTGRLHTSFNQAGTETGRLSSSNPNLQNLPVKTEIGRKIRQAIIAGSKDSCLLAGDYSQIELRILAHLSGDKNLIAEFMEDKDVHKVIAGLIYGLAEKDVNDQMREVAKRVNFGIVYGLTPFGLARDLGISVEEAESFIAAYFIKYPGVKSYIQAQIKSAQQEGFVATILGRRRYIPEINNKNQGIRQFAERQAINAPIQGSASDLIKMAMIQIHRQIKEQGLEAKMILQVHDELVFESAEKEIRQLSALVKEKMENVLKLNLPIRVNMKKGKNWLEMEEIK